MTDRPKNAAEAYTWANTPATRWASSSDGRIEIAITEDDAASGSHSGQCDGDVAELLKVPYIAEQMAGIDPADLRADLAEYGSWDATELLGHEQNLARFLWLVCGRINDGE